MRRRRHEQVPFKPYAQGQLMLPTSLEELIPEGHLVRIVSHVIGGLSMEKLRRAYKGGGTASYHPHLMLKLLVYAYTQRIYTSRQIAKALRENVNFMWLAGGSRPDFRTLNRFRSGTMKAIVDTVFGEVLKHLVEHGYVKLEAYFLDGTKIEANANRHQVVWAKNVKRYQEHLQEKVKVLLGEIDRANAAEQEEYGDRDLEETEGKSSADLDSEALKARIAGLNDRLEQEPENKPLAKAVRTLEKECLPRLERYETQEATLDGRNSYSKTDEDATFMRMKEDTMGTGELRPAYNVQIGTENQFVVGFSVHQLGSDSACLIPHMEDVKGQVAELPDRVVADAAYGSEQNYAYLEQAGVESYVKYSSFDRQDKPSWKKQVYRVENWTYDREHDQFICPENKRLSYDRSHEERSRYGHISERRHYECSECADCPVKARCTRSLGNRRVEVSLALMAWRDQARQNLLSDYGVRLRARRGVEVESVFGRLKHNWGVRRFLLRGIDKVRTEWGLLCMAHNMAKLAA